jgi:hypothetical protein
MGLGYSVTLQRTHEGWRVLKGHLLPELHEVGNAKVIGYTRMNQILCGGDPIYRAQSLTNATAVLYRRVR